MGYRPDIAIIGGGILGVILARLTAEQGLRTVVFRRSDLDVPNADTLRNQSWLQSGLRYVRASKVLAEKMRTHGRRMHEFFGLKPPDGRGIIQVGSEVDAAQLYEDAAALGVRSAIRELPPNTARSLLGPLHRKEGVAFETPESPFEEAVLLHEARETARAAGARFREVANPVKLLPFPTRIPSHRIQVDGEEMEVGTTILAAGAGNIALLECVSSDLRVELRRTPLLVMPGKPVIHSPILLDRSAGFSVVAHPPDTCRLDGCMVIGTNVHEENVAHNDPEIRQIGEKAQQDVYDRLPACLQQRFERSRFTAGLEPIPFSNGKPLPAVAPWVECINGHPDIIASFPGRATLALHAAELVMDKLLPDHSVHDSDGTAAWDSLLPGQDWGSSIRVRMHYENHYDGLNDGRHDKS
jgi:glycine/D-amino acid oxidase-like deaminating enzyme